MIKGHAQISVKLLRGYISQEGENYVIKAMPQVIEKLLTFKSAACRPRVNYH